MDEAIGYDDYKKILKYYNITMPKTRLKTKSMAEKILAEKLCRCIKKVKKKNKLPENRAIGICRNSIFHNRNLNIYQFECKKNAKLRNFKNRTYKIAKRKKENKKTRKNKKD